MTDKDGEMEGKKEKDRKSENTYKERDIQRKKKTHRERQFFIII